MDNNLKALELMILSSTLLGNSNSLLMQEDTKLLLNFLGRSFDLKEDELEKAIKNILGVSSKIETVGDADVFLIDEISEENTVIYEYLKSRMILYLQSFSNATTLHWLDYRYVNPYNCKVHAYNISNLAKEGYLIAVRHLALLHILEIGVSKDIPRAKKLLWNAVFWGDELSLYILKQVFLLEKNKEEYQHVKDLIVLTEQGLYEGTTEIQNEQAYETKTKEVYKLTSSILRDIILAEYDISKSRQIINLSFVEVMLLQSLSFEDKMKYINEYARGEWKKETNKIINKKENIGFF